MFFHAALSFAQSPLPLSDWTCPGETAPRDILLADQLPRTHDQGPHLSCFAHAAAAGVSAAIHRKTLQAPPDLSAEWLTCGATEAIPRAHATAYLMSEIPSPFYTGGYIRPVIDSLLGNGICPATDDFKPRWNAFLSAADRLRAEHPAKKDSADAGADLDASQESLAHQFEASYRAVREESRGDCALQAPIEVAGLRRVALRNSLYTNHGFEIEETIAGMDPTSEVDTRRGIPSPLCDPGSEGVRRLVRIFVKAACANYPLVAGYRSYGVIGQKAGGEPFRGFGPHRRMGHGAVLAGIIHRDGEHGLLFRDSGAEGTESNPIASAHLIPESELCRIMEIDAVLNQKEPLVWDPEEIDSDSSNLKGNLGY